MPLLDLACLLLAALIGFASHRASLCNVKAVAEVLEVRRAWMLASLAVAVLWSATVAGTLILALHWPVLAPLRRSPGWLAIAGGYIFGVGAAINGGCSLSTLQRLADGELAMGVTLGGFALGVLLWTSFESRGVATMLVTTMSPWEAMRTLSKIVLAGLFLWALQEAVRLWRRARALSWANRLGAPVYRLSSAAALLGIAGGLLFALQGSWTYTYVLRTQIASAFGMAPPMAWSAMLALALLAGMLASSMQRRSFALRLPQRRQFLGCFVGGTLMGIGGALLPAATTPCC